MNRFGGLLRELQRRRVLRVAVVYAVAAFGIVEGAEISFDRLGISDDVVTYLLLVALLGFPLALWLSWSFERTPDGIVRQRAASGGDSSRRVPYAAAAGVLLVVAGAAAWLFALRGDRVSATGSDPTSGAVPRPSLVAVLPFRDQSPGQDQGWRAEGLAEEIHSRLTGIQGLDVLGFQSALTLADAPHAEIREVVGATHVLGGSIQTSGDAARIRAWLMDTETGREVWSDVFRPGLTFDFQTQAAIADAVVDVMEVELGPIADAEVVTADTVAHEHYLRGLGLWDRRSEAEIRTAIDHFQTAIERDSAYAAAWAGLSLASLVLPEYSPTVDVALMRDQSASGAAKALEIDPRQPDALTAMGWGRMIHHYDWAGAEEYIGRALEIDSTNVHALHWQSHVLSWQGRTADAVALARKAVAIEPLSPIIRQNLGFILMEAQAFEEALQENARVLTPESNFEVANRTRWNVNHRMGRYDEAADGLREWLVGIGGDETGAESLARAYRDAALAFAESGTPGTLPRTLVDRLRPGVEMAGQLYAAVGDRETTLELLEQAYRERAGARNLLSIGINPLYDFLRDDPAFQDILARVGLASDR